MFIFFFFLHYQLFILCLKIQLISKIYNKYNKSHLELIYREFIFLTYILRIHETKYKIKYKTILNKLK